MERRGYSRGGVVAGTTKAPLLCKGGVRGGFQLVLSF